MPSWAQNDSIRTVDSYVDGFDEMLQNISYRFGIGLFIPASNDHFRVATFFEINANIPIGNDYYIEFAFQLGGWNRENNFTYISRDETLKGTSRIFVSGLSKLKKDIFFFKKSFIGIGAGVGISSISISTDVTEPENEGDEAILEFKAVNSFLLSPELEYVFNVSEETQFSISFSVQYATYKFKVALENDIGNWYFMPKITYRY
jgi:hypothetical protein